MNTYETYRKHFGALTLDECVKKKKKMKEAIGKSEDAVEFYRDLLNKSWDYTAIRFQWGKLDIHGRAEIDARRTSLHDSVIVNFNLIKRFCDSIGTDTSWYDMLGDFKKDPTVRKRFGDFADYICFVEAINQR